jgi:glycosyltransferase involved in cell wall biosynthesis
MRPGITAVIPAHTPRLLDGSLRRAIESVLDQEHPADAIAVAIDARGDGAAATRQRALNMAATELVAFLDADDRLYPNHLRVLAGLADANDADYCYSWFEGNNPFPTHRGRQMNPADPHHTTMTVLVHTALAQSIGFRNHPDAPPTETAEDWLFTLKCLEAGAVFAGTGEVTWHYTVDGRNTSGLASRWTPSTPQADVTIVTPHIPPRRGELLRMLDSVAAQTVLPAAVAIAVDHGREGSAVTRNRALFAASTKWVAFVDDDDALEVNHLAELVACAEETGADVVYSGCTVVGPGGQVLPDREEWGRFGRPFDADLLRRGSYIPVTSLVRTELAHAVGGFRRPAGSPYDDWGFYLALLDGPHVGVAPLGYGAARRAGQHQRTWRPLVARAHGTWSNLEARVLHKPWRKDRPSSHPS